MALMLMSMSPMDPVNLTGRSRVPSLRILASVVVCQHLHLFKGRSQQFGAISPALLHRLLVMLQTKHALSDDLVGFFVHEMQRSVSFERIGDRGALVVALCCPTLERLRLLHSSVSDDAIESFATVAAPSLLNSLYHIALPYSPISDLAISSIVTHFPNIRGKQRNTTTCTAAVVVVVVVVVD
jgi:hypothetical protein